MGACRFDVRGMTLINAEEDDLSEENEVRIRAEWSVVRDRLTTRALPEEAEAEVVVVVPLLPPAAGVDVGEGNESEAFLFSAMAGCIYSGVDVVVDRQ
jgi:hypothetical protein